MDEKEAEARPLMGTIFLVTRVRVVVKGEGVDGRSWRNEEPRKVCI